MNELNINKNTEYSEQSDKYKKLGGLLILFAILQPIAILDEFLHLFSYTKNFINALSNTETNIFLATYQLFQGAIIFPVSICLFIFFLMKKKFVPRFYLIYVSINFILGSIYLILKDVILNKPFSAGFISIFITLVWIIVIFTYVLKSKRVKHTFVR